MMAMATVVHTGIAKALVLYGWMTLGVLHPTSCCPHAHTVDLGIIIVLTRRMWLSPVVLVQLVLLRHQLVSDSYLTSVGQHSSVST